jgi:hypothetical protein
MERESDHYDNKGIDYYNRPVDNAILFYYTYANNNYGNYKHYACPGRAAYCR